MSIVQLKKITVYGCLNEKLEVLEELQTLGCLHIIPLNPQEILLDKEKLARSTEGKEALKYLNDSPQKLKQVKEVSSFDATTIEREVLGNKHKTNALQDESDSLKQQIKELEPWGSFSLPDPKEIGNLKFWFYIVPHQEVKNLKKGTYFQEMVGKDNLFSYIVVISENEPDFKSGTQVKLPNRSLNELKERLDQIDFEMEDLQLQRINLTRWLYLFKKNFFKLEDQVMLKDVTSQTLDSQPLFALQGWVPSLDVEKVRDYAKKKDLALKIEEPALREQPPTLLDNKAPFKGGEDLVSFYMTPSYWLWDPSTTIFFSFAIFFAMIFSDAGYSLILGAILAFYWKHLGKTVSGKRFRNVLLTLTIFSLIWGILVGSYFGVSPSQNRYLSKLKIIDINNYSAMMTLAILVGVIHITLANVAQAWSKRKSLTALSNIGWAFALIGATLLFLGFRYATNVSSIETLGFLFIGMGLLAIIIFTSTEKPVWKRLLKGFMGLTRVTGMFGDVLSYLRLFALGLASASLAVVFNDLARKVYEAVPGFKILFALLIILIGHGMNFMLSLMSGFIHGLRLNFIEFFNWSLPEEGTPFKAFSKKETSKWNH